MKNYVDLLPKLNEITPIVDKKNIFYECEFNTSFDNLSFQKQLQVLCDIVRQSIYPNGIPNPDNDILEMNGNCYTASYCFLNYIKKLHIGVNARCVLARKRKFDPDEITTIHVVVLVNSEDGHVYQVDPTPFAGYKYGSVEDVTYKGIYDEYCAIDDTINNYLYIFRKIIYDDYVKKFNTEQIEEYIKLCHVVDEYPILKGYVAIVLKIILKYLDNEYEKSKIIKWINLIKPYSKYNIDNLNDLKYRLKIETDAWMEELRSLQENNYNAKRQSELAIAIVQENKWLNHSYERFVKIDGQQVRISSINPRFLYEKKQKALLINTSIYSQPYSPIAAVFRNSTFNYTINLSSSTEQLGLKPLLFVQTSIDNYPNAGSCDIASVLYDENYINLIEEYYSGLLCTDFIDFANNYCESSLYSLIGYPEHQVMTKFMYPNRKLFDKR